MTGLVRLIIKNATKEDKGKYTAKIWKLEKVFTETSLKVEGEKMLFKILSLVFHNKIKFYGLLMQQ